MLFIKGAAEASFNYMLAGAILGGVFGFFGSLFIKE